MKLRRRLAIRIEATARRFKYALFWIRHGHAPWQAWTKARDTL